MDDVRVTEISELEQLYRETGDRLWRALLAYTGNREFASDAAAEAFARALASPTTIRDPAAWVWRVAFRVATTLMRASDHGPGGAEPTYEIDHDALNILLALRQLPRRQRAVFILFHLDDRPTAQIAELLGMASATVSVHLHRARKKLRVILGDQDD